MAGESAREFARRQREKAERHARLADAYERGAQGESQTALVLDPLRAQGWWVFHDIRWPGRPRANIDHVVVGPGGLFVIDTKNWSGRIDVTDGTLRQNGRRRETAVVGVGEAAVALTNTLGQIAAQPVLCFVRDEPLTLRTHEVAVCSTATLIRFLTTRPGVLSPEWVTWCGHTLQSQLQPAVSPTRGMTAQRSGTGPARGQRSRTAGRTRAAQRRRERLRRDLWKLIFFVVVMLAVATWLSQYGGG